MASTANFFSTPRTAVTQVTTANTNRDGTGTIATVITGAANGTRVDDIEISAVASSAAGVVRLYLHDGTNSRLLREILVGTITASNTVAAFNSRLTDLGIILASASWSIRASTHNAETFNICVTRAGDA